MPSTYLQPSDFEAYGVTDPSQVLNASQMVDAYLKRPEGLIWSPDARGAPAYMAALTPTMVMTAAGSIAPGSNVVVPIAGGFVSHDLIGEVLILSRSDLSAVEACVVTAAGPGSVTLLSVLFAHSPGATLEQGLVLTEERQLPAKRSVTRVSKLPVARLISGLGRYAYGRRSDQVAGMYQDMNLLATMQAFGGPPMWVPFDVAQASVSNSTGEVWVPAGLLLAYYSEARLHYLTGWPAASLPPAVKTATASIANALANFPEITSNTKSLKAGDTAVERFADTLLDTDTRAQLERFRPQVYY
jgi:hypothetical protein